jgi:hypothetical protein
MGNTAQFDYCQPTRDALIGIYVEVSDAENPAAGSTTPTTTEIPHHQKLFGVSVTVEDENTAEESGRTP